MKVLGKEKFNIRDLTYPAMLDCGTVFRYENGTTLFMKTTNGIVNLESGYYADGSDTYDSYNGADEDMWNTPVKVITVELHII